MRKSVGEDEDEDEDKNEGKEGEDEDGDENDGDEEVKERKGKLNKMRIMMKMDEQEGCSIRTYIIIYRSRFSFVVDKN